MRVWWIESTGVRAYQPEDQARLFKWVLFEHGGELHLAAMPYDAGYLFHMELVAQIALRQGWCAPEAAEAFLKRDGNLFGEAGVRVLGGGVRQADDRVSNSSFRFGAIPAAYLPRVHQALSLA
jgi:hypothetical protein